MGKGGTNMMRVWGGRRGTAKVIRVRRKVEIKGNGIEDE